MSREREEMEEKIQRLSATNDKLLSIIGDLCSKSYSENATEVLSKIVDQYFDDRLDDATSEDAALWIRLAQNVYSDHQCLHLAAKLGKKEIVRLLLGQGSDPNGVDEDFDHFDDWPTPLGVAAQHGHEEVAAVLLEAGADVDKAYHHYTAPLWIASREGHGKVVTALLKAGASVDKVHDGEGMIGETALFAATRRCHLHVIRILLQAGASPTNAATTILNVAAGLDPAGLESVFSPAQVIKAITCPRCTDPERWHTFLVGAVRANKHAAGVEAGTWPPLPPAQRSFLGLISTDLQRSIHSFLWEPRLLYGPSLVGLSNDWTAIQIANTRGHSDALDALRRARVLEEGPKQFDVTFTKVPLIGIELRLGRDKHKEEYAHARIRLQGCFVRAMEFAKAHPVFRNKPREEVERILWRESKSQCPVLDLDVGDRYSLYVNIVHFDAHEALRGGVQEEMIVVAIDGHPLGEMKNGLTDQEFDSIMSRFQDVPCTVTFGRSRAVYAIDDLPPSRFEYK
eukprot:g1951.t1